MFYLILSSVYNLNRICLIVQIIFAVLQKKFCLSHLWLLIPYNYGNNSFIFCIIKCLPRYFVILQFGHLQTIFTWTRAFKFFWSLSSLRNTFYIATQYRYECVHVHTTLKFYKIKHPYHIRCSLLNNFLFNYSL